MKKYKIVNRGCDDETQSIFEFTEEEFEFLKKVFDKLNAASYYECMPKIYIKKTNGECKTK